MTDATHGLRDAQRRFGAAVLLLLAMGALYLRAIQRATASGYAAPGPLFVLVARAVLVLSLGYLLLSAVVEVAVYIEGHGDAEGRTPEAADRD